MLLFLLLSRQRLLSNNSLLKTIKCNTSTFSDPYKVLGVSPDANETTIKNAYFRLAKEVHPDRNPDDDAAKEKFIKTQNAYRMLMEKIAINYPESCEENVPYSMTIYPLAVETHPLPTFTQSPQFKRIVMFVGLFLFAIIVQEFNLRPDLTFKKSERKQLEEKIDALRRQRIKHLKEKKEQVKIGNEMNSLAVSLIPR